MTQEESITLMEQHAVKPTANRIVVLRTLDEAGRPLTLAELEHKILSIDKSGVFRALTLFRDHHLVHVIDDGSGAQRYELCHSHSDLEDDDQHPHFYCEQCHRTFCLTGMPLPQTSLPEGFVTTGCNLVLRGLCPQCSQ